MVLEPSLGRVEIYIMVIISMMNVWAMVRCIGPMDLYTKANGKKVCLVVPCRDGVVVQGLEDVFRFTYPLCLRLSAGGGQVRAQTGARPASTEDGAPAAFAGARTVFRAHLVVVGQE